MMKKIVCLVAVFFLWLSLTVPTLSYADDCSSCCAACDSFTDSFRLMPIMECLSCECNFPCECLVEAYGAGWLCLGIMWESATIPIALGCLGLVNLVFETCKQAAAWEQCLDCPCSDGCP